VTTTNELRRTAQLFHAMSDETRLALLEMLRDGECCVCDLQDALDAAQSRLSFHLKVLKDAGLVIDRKEGRWVQYSLNADTFAELMNLVGAFKPSRRSLSARVLKSCCD
jgi:ArsR family transcriptional regulator, arsenate/arsenite/antimonite-responsive transcriptional repressor